MIFLLKLSLFLSAALCFSSDFSVYFYGGLQGANSSHVTGEDPGPGGVGSFSFKSEWEGRSFRDPFYYGLRAHYWLKPSLALSLDFTHSKIYSTKKTLLDNNLKTIEFTDGINTLTLSALINKSVYKNIFAYIALGAGVSIPKIEFQSAAATYRTFYFHLGGVVAQLQFGVEKKMANGFSLFTEYVLNYHKMDVKLVKQGNLQTQFLSHALNFGFGYGF